MYVNKKRELTVAAEKKRHNRKDNVPVTTTIDRNLREELIKNKISYSNALHAGSEYLLRKQGAIQQELKLFKKKDKDKTEIMAIQKSKIRGLTDILEKLRKDVAEKKRINQKDYENAFKIPLQIQTQYNV